MDNDNDKDKIKGTWGLDGYYRPGTAEVTPIVELKGDFIRGEYVLVKVYKKANYKSPSQVRPTANGRNASFESSQV